jgi:hypothetical protein
MNGLMHFHNGTDYAAEEGDPVYSSYEGGLVKSVVTNGGPGGLQVDVYYPGPALCFKYLHLRKILVREGQILECGKVLAESGNTGFSTGPHLHLSIVPARSMMLGYSRRMMDPYKHYLNPEVCITKFIDPATHAFLGHSEEEP